MRIVITFVLYRKYKAQGLTSTTELALFSCTTIKPVSMSFITEQPLTLIHIIQSNASCSCNIAEQYCKSHRPRAVAQFQFSLIYI